MDNYWRNFNQKLLAKRLEQCNLTQERYLELKESIHNLIRGLSSSNFEDAKFYHNIVKAQKISFSDMSTPIMYDEDTIKLMKELFKDKKWVYTSKRPDNIRKRYPEVIDLTIHNLGGNGGLTTIIRWK